MKTEGSSGTRSAQLRALAKLNLDLRVLHKRADGFHELRTVFQTISLADTIDLEFEPGRRTGITLDDPLQIPDNLLVRAAQAVLDAAKVRGRVRMRLTKRIPMGAGLGGGSSNAAAVLLALPVLIGRSLPLDRLIELGAALGSDVPFFLLGGTAVGIGRGTELFLLPDLRPEPLLVVCSGIHVSTPEAYRELARGLTVTEPSSRLFGFPAYVRTLADVRSAGAASSFSLNDFEAAVFRRHPQLRVLLRKIAKTDARGARMTGSGSTIFGVYATPEQREHARGVFEQDRAARGCRVMPAELVNGRRYRALWRRQLGAHVSGELAWPPQSRYEQ